MVREAASGTIGQRHFDVQLMGGAALHQGNIAEMKTGEGKTLVSTLPGYLNALAGKGVHLVTVNDYLAKRDSEWMGGIYRFLGLDVGLIQASMTPEQRRPGLRGRHHLRHEQRVRVRLPARQHGDATGRVRPARATSFAIVDEVDSILIDEARTPLIISGMVARLARSGTRRSPASRRGSRATRTTRSTRPSTRSPSPSRASRRSRRSSASRTSTTT